jgi:hypothetical protein
MRLGWWRQGTHTEFWFGNLLANVQLDDRKGDGKITEKRRVRIYSVLNTCSVVGMHAFSFIVISIEVHMVACLDSRGLFQSRRVLGTHPYIQHTPKVYATLSIRQ